MEKFKIILKKVNKIIVRFVITLGFKIIYRYKVIGKENIPQEGSVIFCGNHKSYADPPLMVITNPRNMRFMAKEELKNNWLMRYLCFTFDAIYVKRDSKDIKPLKEALKELKNGGCIGIFPEGTRNGLQKNEGKMKNGASYMSLKTGAKLVPIGIKGDFKPFHKIIVTYGKPLDFQSLLEEKTAKGAEEIVTEKLKEEIIKLSE